MFVRVGSVLVTGILLATCFTGTSALEISPNYVHSAPDKPVTFTCSANQVVSACEFLVRYNDVDLNVVNPAQARSGSWELPSSGGQSPAVQGPKRAQVSNGPVETIQGNGQSDVDREITREDKTVATVSSTSRPRVKDAGGRTNVPSSSTQGRGKADTEARVSEEVVRQEDETRSSGRLQHDLTTASPSGRSKNVAGDTRTKVVAEGSTAQEGINGGTTGTTQEKRTAPSEKTSASSPARESSFFGRRQPPGFNDRPVFVTTKRPNTTEQSDEPSSTPSWSFRKRSFTVLGAKDAIRGTPAPLKQTRISPYPANDVQCIRRQHGWKYVYPAPTSKLQSATLQPNLRTRTADDGYQWRARVEENVCTLTLTEVKEGLHLIGCRTRQANGNWEYATASMDVNRYQPVGLTAHIPSIIVSGPNSRVTLTIKSKNPMTSCSVNRTNGTLMSSRTECRATVPAAPGPIWYTGVQRGARKESRAAFVRVLTAPTSIELTVPKTKLMEGEFFTATCAVGVTYPAANISWYLGDELLRADADDDFVDSKWVWPWEGRGLRQSLTMTLTTDDDNMPLTCQVDHPSLKEPLKKSLTMHVTQDLDDGTEDCGSMSDISSRLFGGKKVTAHVPWVAAIYRRMRSGDYEHVCGGTLVSRRLVVSSAQCFWDATFTRVSDPSLFRVALGRSGREWKPSDVRAQSPGIVRLAVPKHFIGRSAHFAYDIAVLVLDSAVTLSDNVLPACVDRTGTLPELQTGDVGSVSGWGITETGRTSPVLRSIDLPYVDLDECFRAVDADLHRYISYDKFCAGYRNQAKSVCPGDSGGGLVFLDPGTGRHYLRGVASVGFAPIGNDENCFADLYTGFTLVSEYATWIFKQAPQPPVTA